MPHEVPSSGERFGRRRIVEMNGVVKPELRNSLELLAGRRPSFCYRKKLPGDR